ncbi:MAG: hypothetical protein H6662_11260 [Ardenticatenaceae bacterium]|nr:hypothetical protein [Ardenticatenaceae bacterium]MCB8991132.1 hypothetical protein [Ardenticatenaceae bacterium]MCB9005288.1 hypothetical protein [Ardenticatenaceae bacterium]
MKSRFAFTFIIILGLLTTIIVTVSAATYITNRTTGGLSPNSPVNLNPGWRFWAQSDTVSGDAICVEVHPVGDTDVNYIRTQCAYDDISGPPNSNWRCDVFTGGVPVEFQSKTIEYQFHTANYDTNCQTNTYLYTGFNWTFNTGPTAVTLQTLNTSQPTSSTLLLIIVLSALGLTSAVFVSKNTAMLHRKHR